MIWSVTLHRAMKSVTTKITTWTFWTVNRDLDMCEKEVRRAGGHFFDWQGPHKCLNVNYIFLFLFRYVWMC